MYLTPLVIIVVFFQTIFLFEVCTHRIITLGPYEYPWWGQAIGMLLAFVSMLCIPLVATIRFINEGSPSVKQVTNLKTTQKKVHFVFLFIYLFIYLI